MNQVKNIFLSLFAFTQKYPLLILIAIVLTFYYPFFIFGKIPFPGDFLTGGYMPWVEGERLTVKNPLISDVFSQLYVWKYLAIDSIKLGEAPLWNPYSFTGNPLLANFQSATLYPANILLFISPTIGWGLFIVSQSLIAATTMYLLLSIWTKHTIARFFGAITFTFGALMTTWVELGTAGHAMAWLPLTIYTIEKFFETNKIRYLLILSFSAALICLAGNVQVTLFSSIFIIFYLSFKYLTTESIKKTMIVLSFCIFAILLASPQLIPSFDFLTESIRMQDSFIKDDNYGLLPISESIRMLIPDFSGNPTTRNYIAFLNYFETSPFIGILTLPFLLALFFYKKQKLDYFLLITSVFFTIFLFDNPIAQAIYTSHIPILTGSYASRIIFIILFCLAILIARSVDYTYQQKNTFYFKKSFFILFIAIIALLVGIHTSKIILNNDINHSQRLNDLTQHGYPEPEIQALLNNLQLRNSVFPSIISFCALISVLLYFFIKRYKKVSLTFLLIILFALHTIDLGRYFLKFNPFTDSYLIFPPHKTLDFLGKDAFNYRSEREHAEILPPNTWIAYKLHFFSGYDPIYSKQFAEYINFINSGKFKTESTIRYAELESSYESQLLDIASVRYFIGIMRDDEGKIGGDLYNHRLHQYPVVLKEKNTIILENPNVLKRVYFANDVKSMSETEVQNQIENKTSLDLRTTTIIHEPFDQTIYASGSATITKSTPNSLVIVTESTQSGLLVVTDQYQKGWRATVDNNPSHIYKTNLIFRSVKVPAGKHTIEFRYIPNSFKLGLLIFGVGLGGLSIISVIAVRRKKL